MRTLFVKIVIKGANWLILNFFRIAISCIRCIQQFIHLRYFVVHYQARMRYVPIPLSCLQTIKPAFCLLKLSLELIPLISYQIVKLFRMFQFASEGEDNLFVCFILLVFILEKTQS